MTTILGLFIGSTLLAAPPCWEIENGLVHLPDGKVSKASVRIALGRFSQVGEAPRDPDCTVIDAAGKPVTAGLVDAYTHLGLAEVELEPGTVDSAPTGTLNASFRVSESYNPASSAIPVARLGGITGAITVPEGPFVSGVGAYVVLHGTTQGETVRAPAIGLFVDVRAVSGPRPGSIDRLRALVDEAGWYSQHKQAVDTAQAREPLFPARDLEVVARLLSHELPLVARVDRAADIEALLRLTEPSAIRLIIAGGAEAWVLAPALALRSVPVIVDGILNGPVNFEARRARADNALLLQKAGVPLILSSFSTHNARTLNQVAGNAVRAGLSPAAALLAITQGPCDAFGLPEYGRIAQGAVANLVIWSGDPLEVTSAPTHVFIDGQPIPLESRQTRLRDRYRKPAALRTP